MILDQWENALRYLGISPELDIALHFLSSLTPGQLAVGSRVELQGADVFYTVSEPTLSARPMTFEFHRRYTDIHVPVTGEERIALCPASSRPADTPFDYRAALPEADIYVYDNNSTDHTDEIARQAGAIVRYEYRQGKGNVIRTMFREIEADCYLMIDGDDTYPAESAREMVDLVLNKKVDMVVGDRLSATYYTENKRPFHNLGNRLVKRLVNTIFKGDVRDIMTGYRAFSYQFVKSFPVLSQGFEIETEMTIHALDKNLSLKSVPVEYRDRPEDSVSKLNTYSDGMRVLRTIARLYKEYRPLSFFGLFAALFGAAGLILFIPVLAEFFRTGLVPRFPTLIVSGVMMTFALLLLVCGFILDTVAKKHRQLFEINLNLLRLTHDKETR